MTGTCGPLFASCLPWDEAVTSRPRWGHTGRALRSEQPGGGCRGVRLTQGGEWRRRLPTRPDPSDTRMCDECQIRTDLGLVRSDVRGGLAPGKPPRPPRLGGGSEQGLQDSEVRHTGSSYREG